jgi:hypothetical protein
MFCCHHTMASKSMIIRASTFSVTCGGKNSTLPIYDSD